jgi:hypothetical protein
MPIMTERLTCLAYSRSVDERKHLLEMLGQQGVKKRLVRILQSSQENIAIEIAGKFPHGLDTPRRLHFQCADMRRKQTVQCKVGSLFLGKGGTFVEHRVGEQRRAF